ncbi:hypothetical protein DMNBHIDG_00718 [Candidatus Methanoperedenaceae archaeon GB37]|nr:hypothetical protein DMNBHIDG_00718 [Candidatus Methanoperedenaceae archaeon GB37]
MKLIRYTLKGALKDAGISIEEFCPTDPALRRAAEFGR